MIKILAKKVSVIYKEKGYYTNSVYFRNAW